MDFTWLKGYCNRISSSSVTELVSKASRTKFVIAHELIKSKYVGESPVKVNFRVVFLVKEVFFIIKITFIELRIFNPG